MDARIVEFVELLCDNVFHVKKYSQYPLQYDEEGDLNETQWESVMISDTKLEDSEIIMYLRKGIEKNKMSFYTRYYLNNYYDPKAYYYALNTALNGIRGLLNDNKQTHEFDLIDRFLELIWISRENLLVYQISNIHDIFDVYSLIRTKIGTCDAILNLFEIYLQSPTANTNEKQSKRWHNPDNLTVLTQNQIAILFHFLRELGFIGKGMQKNEYAEIISKLTGFSAEKIRQKLSHIENKSTSTESVEFTEVDFRITSRVFGKIIAEIQTTVQQKFP